MNHLKRILSVSLVLVMALALMPAWASAQATGTYTIEGSYYIKSDGSLWRDVYVQGSGMGLVYDGETKVMDNVSSVSAGGGCCYAIKTDGSLWSWMTNNATYNYFLGCAKENAPKSHTPIKIMDNVIRAGKGFAVTSDNALWVWGHKNEFGNKTESGGWTPTQNQVPEKIWSGIADVALAGDGAFLLKTDGTLMYVGDWADVVAGQKASFAPTPVAIMKDVAYVNTYMRCVAAVKTDGSLYMWGSTSPNSEVGGFFPADQNKIPVGNAVKVMDGVKKVSVGCPTVVLKADDTLWVYGYRRESNSTLSPIEALPAGYEPITEFTKIAENVTDFTYRSESSYYHYTLCILDTAGTLRNLSYDITYSESVMRPSGISTPPPTPTPPALTARPTSSTVLVNGSNVAFDAYNIGGNNYFKLRDLAYILSGTEKQFDVGWDGVNNAISLTSGKAYTAVGGEMEGKGTGDKTPTATTSKIYLDGKQVTFTAYNIEGNNYFKLRDVGQAFDFNVSWDGANNTIVIATNESYTAD